MDRNVTLPAIVLAVLAICLAVSSSVPAVAQSNNGTVTLPQRERTPAGLFEVQNARQRGGSGPFLHLQAGSFVPGPETPGAVGAAPAAPATAGATGYYLVQFFGPTGAVERATLEALGGGQLAYIPDYAYKLRLTAGQAAQAAAMPGVRWVGAFLPQYKRAPGLVAEDTAVYKVILEQGEPGQPARAAISDSGATLLRVSGDRLLVAANAPQVEAITAVSAVAWLEPFVAAETHNEFGSGIINAQAAHTYDYDGRTQIVAVTDTGLGDGTPAGAHPDIPAARITAIHNWAGPTTGICTVGNGIIDDGARDVSDGHGTHVSGSVLGDGGPAGEGRGTAPGASLVFQAVENYTDSAACRAIFGKRRQYVFAVGLPDDIGDLFAQSYSDGARVHSNSWGSSAFGVYTSSSYELDDFIWDHPDMTITFSAGNDGDDLDGNGVVDLDSIGAPGTAKNALTVGASENARSDAYPCDTELTYTSADAYQSDETCTSMDGENLLGTAARWGFTAEPLFSDPAAGNAQQMAAFSSRGPTNDGRIKPDVVAPGTWILSTFSSLFQREYDPAPEPLTGLYQYDGWGMPYNEYYKYMGGTSMSNPLVAGAAAVVRDYYQQEFGFGASAALVKATLVNSAVDLLDENNDGADDNDYPVPNFHEGWGLVNLAAATDGSHGFIDIKDPEDGLITDYTYAFDEIPVSGTGPFKVTLAWSDYPGSLSASQWLVNTLVLRVLGPNGEDFWGNNFSGGWSQTGAVFDLVNNVQNVFVPNPAAGLWEVRVYGVNVAQATQTFALVLDDAGLAPGRTDVSGQVALQSWPTTDATSVTLSDLGGDFPALSRVPAADGTFYVAGVMTAPGGSTYRFEAARREHLGSELEVMLGSGLHAAALTTLKAGDANNDSAINILDLGCMGSSYLAGVGSCGDMGSTDMNGDGQTNILDLAVAGSNYGLAGLQPW